MLFEKLGLKINLIKNKRCSPEKAGRWDSRLSCNIACGCTPDTEFWSLPCTVRKWWPTQRPCNKENEGSYLLIQSPSKMPGFYYSHRTYHTNYVLQRIQETKASKVTPTDLSLFHHKYELRCSFITYLGTSDGRDRDVFSRGERFSQSDPGQLDGRDRDVCSRGLANHGTTGRTG
jgi:hypothetical protein